MPSRKAVFEMKVVDRGKILRSYYFLFPTLKFPLKGRHFQTVEEIQCAVRSELNVSTTAVLEGIKSLKERENKCIDQGGMYFEE
jgi:hypothetical protein